jgi:TPR repeat protein
MRKLARALGAGMLLTGMATLSPALAGPFEDGQAAFERGDYAAALQMWRRLAENGDAQAQNTVGDMYATRRARLSQGSGEDSEAAKWYLKAAEQGFAPAQSNLGRIYYEGLGVPRDLAEAAKWRRKAADQGYAEAQAWLGKHYRDGEGVPQDDVQAYLWFDLAAPTPIGIAFDAGRSRDRLAARMTPDQLAEARRLVRAWKPGS